MDLICYLHPGWQPLIRPAEATRDWMDRTAERFAYRCLPLNIANAHGWEVLTACAFDAYWTGRAGTEDVIIRLPRGAPSEMAPVSIFGNGMLTFHVFGLFRTPPGWNLWVGGSPNRLKEGITPLSGVIETDWSPYTFTMNWRFTRRNHWVRFSAHEPVCFLFPVQRAILEHVVPRYVNLEQAPEVLAQFKAWSASRDAFQAHVAAHPPAAPADKWQKRYYRGIDMQDCPAPDHRAKLRLREFVHDPAGSPVREAGLGEALGAVLAGLQRGAADTELLSYLAELGLSEIAARKALETARAGAAADH